MGDPVMESRENTASNNRNSQRIGPRRPTSRWPASPQQVAPDTMLLDEVNNRMKSFEQLHSKLLFTANEALQDASTVSWMLTCIKQLMSTQSTQYTEHVSPLFVPTPHVSPVFFPVTPLLSQRSHIRPKNAQNPVGCSSSPKLREEIDSVEAPIETYFDEAENPEKTWRKTSRGCKGAVSEAQFKARQEAWEVMSSLSPKGCKPAAIPAHVRTPACSPVEISKDPDTTNRGDNEGIVTFAESRSTVNSTVKQQPVNTGGDEPKVESSRFVSMSPPQPTIEHGVPLKESNSSNEGEDSNGEEPEQDRSPESKHEGTGTKKLGPTAETERVSSAPTAETECVSSESTATELSDTKDDSVNRGEKDNDRFTQSSNQDKRTDDESENRGEKDYRFSQSSEKQYAIREIESTLEDAKNNADFVKKQSPAWYDRFECKQCKQSEKGADCCYLKWMNKEGKNAGKGPSKQAVDSILPTVRDIAKGVTASLTWCTHHGCLNEATGKCN